MGCWSLPGGVVKAGESELGAAIREMKEENGLDELILYGVGFYHRL